MATALSEPGGLITLALDPEVSPPGDRTSDRILDAALELAAASGFRNLTMEGVAARAGFGRATVYRRFGDRAGLVQALTVREARRGLAEVSAALDPGAGAEERMAAGFVAALRVARRHPLLRRVSEVEPETLLRELRAPGNPLFGILRGFMAAQLREDSAAGIVKVEDVEEAAELLVRIGLSFVLLPDGVLKIEDEEGARRIARSLIAPIVAAGQAHA